MRSRSPGLGGRRGVVLIVVLGVLMLLALLATTFAQLNSLERSVAAGYIDEVRAKLVARGGIDWTVGHVSSLVNAGLFSHRSMEYWGDNLDEVGIPNWTVPLERAQNPSFAREEEPTQNPDDPNVKPMLFTVDGQPMGISGVMDTSRYGANSDVYRLRVEDANSKLYVNDGLEGTNDGPVSQNMRHILNCLGKVVGINAPGDLIIKNRPPDGYRSKREVERVLGSADFKKIEPFITTCAWVDPNVNNPVPLSQEAATKQDLYRVHYNKSIGLYRYGRSRLAGTSKDFGAILGTALRVAPEMCQPNDNDHAIMALDEINAQFIERASRAPVHVNGASEEVLTALISGLRGFFVMERRKSNPIPYNVYSFLAHPKYDNGNFKTPIRGDERGFLYTTGKYLAPGESGVGVPAQKIAKEIIACRNRQKSPAVPSIHYGNVWYGGPFRTWRQFNAFCDALVEGGLIVDARAGLFLDYAQASKATKGGNVEYPGPNEIKLASDLQAKYASQAMADVLKANFNPNCTLNELNPNANLHLFVDKTDLIVNSTEFCFTPMGVYEIESEGLVIRPTDHPDFFTGRTGTVAARRKLHCQVRIFDAYRETTQADFYKGTLEKKLPHVAMTNNGMTLEIGPEPDNGKAPEECRWSGWLQLPTMGGHWSNSDAHQPGTLVTTKPGGGGSDSLNSGMHGHFTVDFRLHDHPTSTEPIRSQQGDYYRNNYDRTESEAGPYGPTETGPTGQQSWYRQAHTWDPLKKTTGAALQYRAPGDLRLDGAYVERDSALMYALDTKFFGSYGTVSMWIKPSFMPETTGKPRTFYSVDTVKGSYSQIINGLWFFASHDAAAYTNSITESQDFWYKISNSGYWRPASLACGFSMWDSIGGGIGTLTDSLNHVSHKHAPNSYLPPDYVQAHRWFHVVYLWDMNERRTRIIVNGVPGENLPNTAEVLVHQEEKRVKISGSDYFTAGNCVRLGEPSKTMEAGGFGAAVGASRNWAADATIDEVFMWNSQDDKSPLTIWGRGRYYRSQDVDGYRSMFTSGPITFGASAARQLPTSTIITPPPNTVPAGGGGTSAGPPPVVVSPPSPGTSASAQPSVVRILNVAWTWYPEEMKTVAGAAGQAKPVVYDYNGWDYKTNPTEVKVTVDLRLLVNETPVDVTVTDDGGSVINDVFLTDKDVLKYRLRMWLSSDAAAGGRPVSKAILLSTPVIDDVTIYFTNGIQYLSYEMAEATL